MRKILFIATFLLLATVSCQRARDVKHLYIIATNDVHANIYAMPQLATLVDEYEAKGEVLVVDSGDRVSGNAFVDDGSEPGVPMIELMNAVGYDYVGFGNHEFDKGPEALGRMIGVSTAQWLSANMISYNEAVAVAPYAIYEYEGVKLAFVGVVDTDDNGHPLGQESVYADFEFRSDAQAAFDAVLEADTKADFVVVLSHMGLTLDRLFIGMQPNCQWVAGGHSHDIVNEDIMGVRLTQNGKNLGVVTVADIEISNGAIVGVSYSQEVIDDELAKESVTAIVARIKSQNEELNAVEGRALGQFTHAGVANLTVEAVADYPYADFTPELSFYHYGGVRLSSILPGDITRGDIFNNDPFNSEIFIGELTTEQIKEFILRKYNNWGDDGRVDKESHYAYFRSDVPYQIIVGDSPAELPDAVDICIDLEPERSYRVAMGDYMAKKYIDEAIVESQLRPSGVFVREALMHYVHSHSEGLVPDNEVHQIEIKK